MVDTIQASGASGAANAAQAVGGNASQQAAVVSTDSRVSAAIRESGGKYTISGGGGGTSRDARTMVPDGNTDVNDIRNAAIQQGLKHEGGGFIESDSSGGGGSSSTNRVLVKTTPYITKDISDALKSSGVNSGNKGNYTISSGNQTGTPEVGTANNEFMANPNGIPAAVAASQTRTVTPELINNNYPKPTDGFRELLTATSDVPIIGTATKTAETILYKPNGEFAPVAPFYRPAVQGRLVEYQEYDGSGQARSDAGVETFVTLGLSTVGLGGVSVAAKGATTGAKIISATKTAGKTTAKTGGSLLVFGTLANVGGGDNPITEKTTAASDALRKTSDDLIQSGDPWKTAIGYVTAPLFGMTSGTIGAVGGTVSAAEGVSKLVTGNNDKDVLTAGKETVTGFVDYLKEGATTNPLFVAGEMAGFSKGYNKIAKAPGNIAKTVGTKTGIIDTRIINTGESNIVPAQNPLLATAIAGGAVNPEGMLRLDTAPRVSVSADNGRVSVKKIDNTGTLLTIRDKSGKIIATAGESNPLSKSGTVDLEHAANDYPLHTAGKIQAIPFMYGTSTHNGAGTVLGMLDQSAAAPINKAASAAVYAALPLSVATHRGKVVTYKMTDEVKTAADGKTQSDVPYVPGRWSEYYRIKNTGDNKFDRETLKETLSDNRGFYPTTSPKNFTDKWAVENESEFAWTTKGGENPQFETAKFGGYTLLGNKIVKLGSSQSVLSTIAENRRANSDTVKNSAARNNADAKETGINIKKAPRDVINFFARDVAFRLAETVGKPAGKTDITKHGAEHVEDVANIAKILKDSQGNKFAKVSDAEIYYAGILHDAAKNTERENVPGGHGEMMGSIIRSGASLDARKYMQPEAVKEFESILGEAGTAKYNAFLRGWDALPAKSKANVATAVTQHTSNLQGGRGISGTAKLLASQTHRLTTGKLSRLLSDADRITLTSRYGVKTDPLRMFASQKTVSGAINTYYGKQQTSAARLLIDAAMPAGQKPRASAQRIRAEYDGYAKPAKGTKPAVYPGGYREGKSGKPAGYLGQYTGGTSAGTGGYNPSGKGYKVQTGGNYPGIGYSGRSGKKSGGVGYVGNRLSNDIKIQQQRRKRDDKRNKDIDYYSAARRGRIDHLSLVDPLEMLGRGSMTNRKRADVTLYREKIYLVDNQLQTTKPAGRRRKL